MLFSKLLEILVLKHISRVPPCEASLPDDSENVVVFGIFLYDFTLFGIDIQYTPEYVHFTHFNLILPLSIGSDFGTAFITIAHSLLYSEILKKQLDVMLG